MIALASVAALTGWLLLLLGALGALYMAAATMVLARFLAQRRTVAIRTDAVTLLKPLHGAEPRLADNLASFLEQDHAGPVQMVLGVQRGDDPAIAAVRALQARYPAARIDLIVDGTRHGANGKISNLVNMTRHAVHDRLILSDSDMTVPRDYLAQVLDALDAPGTGAVTCLYRGRGDSGFWSRVAAAGPSYQFLVGLVFAKRMNLARPCMGSTIALRRETLEAIGGFDAFADVLADDHAIGQAVERLGQSVAVPPLLLTHASTERSLTEVWRHELRWSATVRSVAPGGHAGSFLAIPLPMALAGAVFHPLPGLAVVALTLAVRIATVRLVDAHARENTAPLWTLPLRDCLSFAIFLASLFARSVDWRGAQLNMVADGRVVARSETV